ncbi:aspartate kinase [Maribacter sp. TH_r10]|uniref:Aspartate kinase n=1 Tax=Maribacter luteus TaxID=2594478 RepID=A0A6I2MMH9_9FLAO|nr:MULTISPECIES: aspartate kinase [Maribacter]MDV7137346.1 aspartate kinase [Maribacter sp. TH_r10]MRX63675.1 aspartate kinase [Maribacter luteus]|tara:strand:+ start:1895 stop:2554 length:660 start_codon:yes stop_codon:yes gene_type:complete
MKTISSVVEEYIKKKPFLQSALAQGIINLTSLSRIIKPEIEEQLGKDVRNGAIVMALKRLSDDLEFRATHKIIKVLKNIGEITVRSSLTDYTFLASDTILTQQAKLLEEIHSNQDVFYTSSRGVNEINIVISNMMDATVETLFKTERCTQKANNLSSITVKLPAENVSVPGIYYFIFQRLAWEGIVLYEVISTTNEFTIIVNDNQVDIAFKTIKDLKTL